MSTSSQLVNVAVSEGEEDDEPLTVFTLGFYSLSKDFEGLWSCEVFHPSGISLNKDTYHLEIYGNYFVRMVVSDVELLILSVKFCLQLPM